MSRRRRHGAVMAARDFAALLVMLLVASLGKALAAEPTVKAVSVSKAWAVRWEPSKLVNGSPVVLRVTPSMQLKSLSGKWLEHGIFFDLDPKTKTWSAIAGVGLDVKPGVYTLMLNGITRSGKEASFSRRITVRAAKYRTIAIKVETKYTEPSPEQLEIINRDKQIKQDTFSHVITERAWVGAFLGPLQAPISDSFGTQRTFNGQVRSVHQGLDFGAPTGMSIAAVNAGTVLLARPLYFEGNCVVVDHGDGLLTLYLHMSELKVKEGEKVTRGQELGLVGGTGRASGPHLHFAVRWQGTYLNPETLLKLTLP